jgi:lipoprotein-anchoring transpeptidase ErfK/SrfK
MFYLSYSYAFASADFENDAYDSSNGFGTIASNDSYDNDSQLPLQRLAKNNSVNDYDDNDSDSSSHRPKKPLKKSKSFSSTSYVSRLPQSINGYNEKVIIINPRKHVWGAYSAEGKLLRAGLATAGSSWCSDIHRACRTRSGTFRIYTLGSRSCYSKRYPVGRGGAPMPYCMFFNGNQGLHGSHEIAEANLSHGCVRISVSDAKWVRFNFATIGTKVVVTSY